MITIHQPRVEHIGEKSRLTATLDIDGQPKNLWFEVDEEYKKYLCYERSDAFLFAVLPFAMRKGYDITCAAPVTDELLYNIVMHLLPALCKASQNFHFPTIICECANEPLVNYGGVGTGMSCGIDSFHAVMQHLNPAVGGGSFKLTHLCVFNVGSFSTYEQTGMAETTKSTVYRKAKYVADELDLPLVNTDSNIRDVLFLDIVSYFDQVITWNNAFAVLAMQKLWKTYYIGSGHSYSDFALDKRVEIDVALYDLLSCNCFSTRSLRIYSEGGALSRIEKTNNVADFPTARKHLHVCFRRDYNCGLCGKCRRTMLTLDLLDKLDLFSDSLPVEYFKANKVDYLIWLVKSMSIHKNLHATRIYEQMIQSGKYMKELQEITNLLKANRTELPMLNNANIKLRSNYSVSLSGQCSHCSSEVSFDSLHFASANYRQCPVCKKMLCTNPFLYCDLNKLNANVAKMLENRNIGIWAITPDNIQILLDKIPILESDKVFLLNKNTSLLSSLSYKGKRVYDPHHIINSEKIDTIIVPNNPEIFFAVKRQCELEFPQVTQIIHITELI